jgi:hypothetical protein
MISDQLDPLGRSLAAELTAPGGGVPGLLVQAEDAG